MVDQTALMFLSGMVMGLSGGLAPGPLTTLVVSQTLMYGRLEGMKAAFAPLVTDAPIILACMWILNRLAGTGWFLGSLSLLGAALLAYYGVECFRFQTAKAQREMKDPRSLWKGIWVNLLNPHPYLFWSTVGGPLMVRSFPDGWQPSACFLIGFYGSLVGAKLLMAAVSGLVSGRWGRAVVWINRGLGAGLWLLAVGLVREGVRLLTD